MRKPRQKSKSGYYHTVIRGVNKQNMFYEDSDRYYFKKLMKKFSKKYKIRIHAYVFMDNHVHLLFDDMNGNISKFMQVLCSVYAKYFNMKYDRIGHLFQDRFASEVVEDNGYLVVCCRYILQNPQRAGICQASDYKWSSFNLYKQRHRLICSSVLIGIFKTVDAFYKYINECTDDECLEIELRPSEKRSNLVETVKQILKSENPIINPDLPREEILNKIRCLKDSKISINNIVRITGIGRYIVQQA